MKRLGIILIVFVAIISILPIRDVLDDDALNYSTVKRAIEGLDSADESFINDINRIGLITEALSVGLTEGKKVDVEYATKNEYESHYGEFVTKDDYVIFRLRVRTDASNEYYIEYPTQFRVGVDDWESYKKYVTDLYRPINAFLDIYNEYLESDNVFTDVLLMLGLIASALFAIVYILVVFFFDTISVLWGVILCILRIIGLVPLPRT